MVRGRVTNHRLILVVGTDLRSLLGEIIRIDLQATSTTVTRNPDRSLSLMDLLVASHLKETSGAADKDPIVHLVLPAVRAPRAHRHPLHHDPDLESGLGDETRLAQST
jgi:hypothetical protein